VTGVNLGGFFWLTQRVIAEMLKQRGSHVVNISATIAEYANSGSPAVLTALTKGGLAAATRSLAVEYASRGIRVNAVSPGIIQTPEYPAESGTNEAATSPPGNNPACSPPKCAPRSGRYADPVSSPSGCPRPRRLSAHASSQAS
jgi:NAD(P)-dependent dehydrogenase (short-subunit alcohol dehydrogenase family)